MLAIAELGLRLIENDAQAPTVGQRHPFAQAAIVAEAVEHARDGSGILAELGRFALEPVDFLDDFNGNEDVIVFEAEDGVGVVEEDVGVEYVIFHSYVLVSVNLILLMRPCHAFNFG